MICPCRREGEKLQFYLNMNRYSHEEVIMRGNAINDTRNVQADETRRLAAMSDERGLTKVS